MTPPTTVSEIDREANYFAMCLLMPESMVGRELKKFPKGIEEDAVIANLSKVFQVSRLNMTLRLVQLGYFNPSNDTN